MTDPGATLYQPSMPSDAAQRRRAVYEYNRFNRDRWVEDCAASVQPGKDVLDVGAGVAPYRQLFAHCSYKAHDFGQEPATIGHYTPLDFESDITSIPAPDASFDVILCTEVIEHVPDPAAAVAEMARLLRPGGRLFLSAPLGSLLHQQPYHYYGGYTPFWYERVLPQFGLRILSIQRNGGFFQWFAQEALRFSAYLNPRRTGSVPFARRAGLTVLWAALLPITRGLLPRIARSLDTLNLESIATAGYHVVAVKAA